MAEPSQFEETFNLEVFLAGIEGILSKWRGDYDIFLNDRRDYFNLPKSQKSSTVLTSRVRSKSRAVFENDLLASERAAQLRRPTRFTDAMGLQNSAIPIFSLGNPAATLIIGRVFSEHSDRRARALERIASLEETHRIPTGELIAIAGKIPTIADEAFQAVEEELMRFLQFFYEQQNQGNQLAHLQTQYEDLHRRTIARADRLMRINNYTEGIAARLGKVTINQYQGIKESRNVFWQQGCEILVQLVKLLEASFAVLLVPRPKHENQYAVTASGGLAYDVFDRLVSMEADVTDKLTESSQVVQVPYKPHFRSFAPLLRKLDTLFEMRLEQVLLAPFSVTEQLVGYIAVFLDRDHTAGSKLTESEEQSVVHVTAALVGSYSLVLNAAEKRQSEIKANTVWLEKVTHQLLSPLNGLQGHAEILVTRLKKWETENPNLWLTWSRDNADWLKNKAQSIISTTHQAARIAANLAWRVNAHLEGIEFEVLGNAVGYFIEIVRDYQGLASEHFLKVAVDPSIGVLDNKIQVSLETLRQAVGNIIDNGIKYSYPNTTITVSADIRDAWAVIEISNIGIQLQEDETEQIFEYEYRASSAIQTNAPGTGIGLTVSREIVRMHGGALTAQPSVKFGVGWKTVFVIQLPLI